MADSKKAGDLEDVLKPFYRRASEAEDRLSRLEAALARERSAANEDHLRKISQLESELELAKSELVLQQEKTQTLSGEAQKLAQENAKLQYRIEHLVRAFKEADRRLEGQ
ncbi:uncharacterized protein LOC116208560 [Punica granatum]|uniref:Uncharacterized protein LOC116208560 n=2 Tax=Punica granatum TaxID=22663 RepID=A0A6P8DKP3_PUNGR|nr:uncharacterized protein LOC116208560 [Punica granatum]PKI38922.1 hypothetical protein CRG98_040694 [Punica granatum]